MGFSLLVLLFILFLVTAPWWPYSRPWGHWPSGIVLALLAIWIALLWLGMITFNWPWSPTAPSPGAV